MSLTLIKEDGSGLTDANTYADVADGDAFAEASLYATAWTNANPDQKAASLAQATRLIDQQWQFYGYKKSQSQALQWPRYLVPDPDSDDRTYWASGILTGPYLPEDQVPKAVIDATCDMALHLLQGDRTGDAQGGAGGMKSAEIEGALKVEFFEGIDPVPVLPQTVQTALWKYGQPAGQGAGVVKLSRA